MYNMAQQRTNMHSHAWMNRQSQQVELSPSSQNVSQFNFSNASNRQPAAVSSQQPVRGEQTSPYGFHGIAQRVGYSSSGNPHLISPNMLTANATHHLQDTSAHWSQPVRKQAQRTFQHFRIQKNMLQNVNVESAKPLPAYSTRATSHPQKDMQPRYSPSFSPTNTLTNNNISMDLPTYHQAVYRTNPRYKTQQYQTQFISTLDTGKAATFPINPNSISCQNKNRPTLSSTHKPPLNPVADTEEQVIQRIAQDLRQSFPPAMRSHHSMYSAQQVNQIMQPMTSAPHENYNRVFQSSSVNCGVSLPKTSYSMISGTQHSAGAPLQENTAPDGFYYGTSTAAKSVNEGEDRNTLSHKNICKGPVESYYAAKINFKHCESETPPSAVAKGQKMMLFSGNTNDGSIHSTPGNIGTRAVAVVQPLPLESSQPANGCPSPDAINQFTEDAAKDESLSLPGKLLPSPEEAQNSHGSHHDLENLNQRMSYKSLNSHSALSTDDDWNQDLSQKQLYADDTGSELEINMHIDHSVAPIAQQSGEGTNVLCTCCEEDKSENVSDTKACGRKLYSVPTHQWTVATLSDKIQKASKDLMNISDNCNLPPFSLEGLLEMFWDSNLRNVFSLVKTGNYRNIIFEINDFCKKHVTLNSVIFSQVVPQCAKLLKCFHVLKDGENYVEQPYKSSWLNVNEQLNDIDKEPGFQCFFQHYLHGLDRSSWQDHIDSTPAESSDQVSNEVCSETELEPVDSCEDKQPSAIEATTPTQNASPDTAELPDPSDPHYSFQIQILPPEEAKAIYEHGLSKMPHSVEMDSEPEKDTNRVVDNHQPSVNNTLLVESTERSKLFYPVAEICCFKRFMEVNRESGKPPSRKCDCQEHQIHGNSDDSTADRGNVEPNGILYNATEGENKADSKKNVNIQSSTSEREFSEQTLDLEIDTELPQVKLSESNVSEDSGTWETSTSDSEIQSGPEVDCDQEMCETGETMQWCTPDSTEKSEDLTGSESDDPSQTSRLTRNHGKPQLTSTHKTTSSLETKEQSKVSVTAAFNSEVRLTGKHKTKKRKIPSTKKCSPLSKNSNSYPADIGPQPKRRKVLCDINERKPAHPEDKTVKLALFGSAAQGKDGPIDRKFRHISPHPPEVLFITYSPLVGKPSQSAPTASIKKAIQQKLFSTNYNSIVHCTNKLSRRKDAFSKGFKVTLRKSGPTPTAQWSSQLSCNGQRDRKEQKTRKIRWK